ncbi:Alpha/Beta hydrolase protein [Tricladium varicosporioides]|nr:Alpha/Beta hydrolase protein [Hymenoscyphus varicosporioides]
MNDRHTLVWRRPTQLLSDLPPGIVRQWINTPDGQLELLSAQPDLSIPRKQAIIFQHGGFGYAAVWIPYLKWFAKHGYPCYALSLRGHGGSWQPGYFRMVWMTGLKTLASDLQFAFTWVEAYEAAKRDGNFEEKDLVLVGHSSGGGLAQYFVGKGLGKVGGLVVFAGIPSYGGFGVYVNWFKLDPWFAPRYYIRDLWHPRSPLSSTTLVHRAFFTPELPVAEVKKFEKYIPEYESMLWPLGMMWHVINASCVLKNIVSCNANCAGLLVVAGQFDKLVSVPLMHRLAMVYGKALAKFSWQRHSMGEKREFRGKVMFEIIPNSGHHVQNDVNWEEGAEKIFAFLKQL